MEYAVIGLGRFGLSLAYNLQQAGHDVVAIDIDQQTCNQAAEILDNVLRLDASDPKAIKEIDINRFDRVIVGIGQDAMTASFLTCLTLIECGVRNIIAKASTDEHKKILKRIGVSEVVMPEMDMGRKVAKRLSRNFDLDCFEFGDGVRADTVIVTDEMTNVVSRSIDKINLRKNFNINIIAIKRQDNVIVPDGSTEVLVGDKILVVGEESNLDLFESKLVKVKKHGLF